MSGRRFPIMFGRGEDGPVTISWPLAEKAYAAYCALPGCSGQSLERLAERGGFHASEMDELLPSWRIDEGSP